MILFLAWLLLADGPSPEVTVFLRAEAQVHGTEVELGEIAAIQASDPESVRRLQDFELGSAPAPGYSRLFLAERVREELERRLQGLSVRMAGERACRVVPAVEVLAAQEIEEVARGEIAQAFAGRDVKLELHGEIPTVEIPVGTEGRSLRAQSLSLPVTTGVLSLPVDVLVDGVRYRTVWTSWNVELFETRAVLAKSVRAGEALTEKSFTSARVLVRPGAGDPLAREALVGAVAVRDLAPGEDVTAQDVHRPRVLDTGETVFLCVRKGAIEARVSALVIEGGAVGDRIRVRAAGSTQELLATVKSRDLCEIDLGP